MRGSIRKSSVLTVYLIAFYSIWTVWEFWGKSLVDAVLKEEWAAQMIKSGVVKNLVWTLPALLLIRHFSSDIAIPFREIFSAKISWPKYLPVFIVFTIYILTGSMLKNGRVEMAGEFGLDKIIIVLFVGITEEMVFRGWLLNAMICDNKPWPSIFLNAVLFLAIHFPGWICTGVFVHRFTSLQCLEVMALGVVFSRAFIKSRSIFVPIALHMYWDLLVFLFI